MEIRTTYIGILDGVHGIWCGFKPKGLVIESEQLVLYPKEGYILVNKQSGEEQFSVCINSKEEKSDWAEVEIQEDDIESTTDE